MHVARNAASEVHLPSSLALDRTGPLEPFWAGLGPTSCR